MRLLLALLAAFIPVAGFSACCGGDLPADDRPVIPVQSLVIAADGTGLLDLAFPAAWPEGGYDLVVAGGDAATGAASPADVSVILNGQTVLADATWDLRSPLAVVGIGLRAANTMRIQAKGAPGALLRVIIRRPGPCQTTLLDGWTVIRGKGKPVTERKDVALPASAGTTYRLVVYNGVTPGTDLRATSGRIWFNGREVFTPDDFKHKTALLCAEVTVQGTNRIEVELAGTPNDQVTIGLLAVDRRGQVVGFAEPAISLSENEGPAQARLVLGHIQTCPLPVALVTRDGGAVAGADYRGMQAVAWIPGGASELMVPVQIIDDSTVEETESFRLCLERAYGAEIAISVPILATSCARGDREAKSHGRSQSGHEKRGCAKGSRGEWDDCDRGGFDPRGRDGRSGDAGDCRTEACLQIDILDDDKTGVMPSLAWESAGRTVGEDIGATILRMRLDRASAVPVTVHYLVDGSATLGQDHFLASGSLTIPVGDLTADLELVLLDDLIDEPTERVRVVLSDISGAQLGTILTTAVDILDDDEPPTLAFRTTGQVVAEGAGSAVIWMDLSGPSGQQVSVTVGRSGTASVDDVPAFSPAWMIPAGSTEVGIPVTILDDFLDEEDETVVLSIVAVAGAIALEPTVHTLVIFDDDASPVVRLEPALGEIAEAGGSGEFQVVLDAISGREVRVSLAVIGTAIPGTDFVSLPQEVVVPAGVLRSSVAVIAMDDLVDEVDETVLVTATGAAGAVLGLELTSAWTIIDDDAPPTVRILTPAQQVVEADAQVAIAVGLHAVSSKPVTVSLAWAGTATPGSDVGALPASLTIPAGALSASLSLQILDDDLDELDETLTVTLIAATDATIDAPDQTQVTILDQDDPVQVTFAQAASTWPESGPAGPIVLSLNRPSGRPVSVTIVTSGSAVLDTDATLSTSTVVFPPGVVLAEAVFTPMDDALDEIDEVMVLALQAPEGATVGAIDVHRAEIIDDDAAPTVTLGPVEQTIREDGGQSAEVTLTLSEISGRSVSVQMHGTGTATPGTDIQALPEEVIIPAGVLVATFSLAPIDDGLDEMDETLVLSVATASGATPSGSATVIIQDDDEPPTVAFVQATSAVSEAAGSASVALQLSALSGRDITVAYVVSGTATAADHGFVAGVALIPAGQIGGVLTATIADDTIDEPDETILLTLTSADGAGLGDPVAHALTIQDNDAPPTVAFQHPATQVGEDAGAIQIFLVLDHPSSVDLVLDLAVSGTATVGSDVTLATQVAVPAMATQVPIAIQVIDDDRREPDENLVLDLVLPAAVLPGVPVRHVLTISDNDPIPQVHFAVAASSVSESEGGIAIRVVLDRPDAAETSVSVSLGGSALRDLDYLLASEQVVIPAGATETVIDLGIIDDLDLEADETVILTLVDPQGLVIGEPSVHTLTISSDDRFQIRPIAECIQDNGDGTVTVFFGYENLDTQATRMDVGVKNRFEPGTDDRGQVIVFAPGRSPAWPDLPFSLVMPEDQLTWQLQNLTATADRSLPACPTVPFLAPLVLPPRVNILAPGDGTLLPSGVGVSVRVDALDVDGTVALLELLADGVVMATIANPPQRNRVDLPPLAAGAHTLRARATDAQGHVGQSEPVVITVAQAPTVQINAPALLASGASIPVSVAVAAGSQPVVSVNLFRGDLMVASETTGFDLTLGDAAAPEEILTARVRDTLGLESVAELRVRVGEPPQVAVVAPDAERLVQPWNGLVPLVAAAADPDGQVVRVRFQVDGVEVGMASASPWRFDWNAGARTSAVLTAEAEDDLGFRALSQPVAITINAVPQVAIITPSDGAVVQIDDPVTIHAEASDADGSLSALVVLVDGARVAETGEATLDVPLATATPRSVVVAAEAYDGDGGRAVSAPVTVRVNAVPEVQLLAPLASAVPDQGASTPLRATATDADGTVQRIRFLVDGVVVAVVEGASGEATWTPSGYGLHQVQARAEDEDGGFTVATAQVTVNGLPIPAFTMGEAVPVLGRPYPITADAEDVDGSISALRAYADGDLIGAVSTAVLATTWTPSAGGPALLHLEAVDNRGAVGRLDLAVVVDLPPAVALTAPIVGEVLPPDAAVTLSATASDADGMVVQVDFLADGQVVGTATSAPWSIAVTLPAGATALVARATDDRGVTTDSAVVPVRVNRPPTLTLRRNPPTGTLSSGDPFQVIADTTDSDGVVTSVAWSLDGAFLGVDTEAPFAWDIAGLPGGPHRIEAIATDSDGAATTAAYALTINERPRVILATPVYGSVVGDNDLITLTADASDLDGSIASVTYLAGKDGAEPSEVNVGVGHPFTAQWVAPASGTWTLVAVATDDLGVTGRSQPVAITVNAAPTATLSIRNLAGMYDPEAGLILDVTATDDQGIAEVRFLQDGEVFAVDNSEPYSVAWFGAESTLHRVEAQAVDLLGAIGRSNWFTIGLNQAPTVSILAPLGGQVFQTGTGLVVQASVADADGTIAQAEFLLDGVVIGTRTDQPWQVPLGDLAPGEYEVHVRATDQGGLTSTAGPVVFRVNAQPTIALTEPIGGFVVAQHQPVTLTATAADADGTVLGVEFYRGTVFLGADATAPYSIATAFADAGPVQIHAEVVDDRGGRAVSASVGITVNAVPLVSLSLPGTGDSVPYGAPVDLVATAIDPDGSIASVAFYDGATLLHTATAAPWTFQATGLLPGSHLFSALATDQHGASARSVWIALSVTPPGTEPPELAVIEPANGAQFPVGSDIPFVFAVSDSDGQVVSLTISEGTTILAELTAAPWSWTWVNAPGGRHRLNFVATDDAGSTRSISGYTVIVNAAPTVAITSPASAAVIAQDATATVRVTASDSDGSLVGVRLRRDGQIVASSATAPAEFPLNTATPGSIVLIAEAIDDLGAVGASSAVSVRINAPPSIVLTEPQADAVVALGENLRIVAEASDAEGPLAVVELRVDGRLVSSQTTPPFGLDLSGLTLGAHEVQAVAIDAHGLRATSVAIPIRVSRPPVVSLSAPLAGSTLAAGTLATVSAQAVDTDDGVARVEFFAGAERIGVDTTAPFSVSWLVAGSGSRILRAEAIDQAGLRSVSAPVSVLINAAPVVLVSEPTAGSLHAEGSDISVSVSTSDADGDVAELHLRLDNQPLATVAGSTWTGTVGGLARGSHILVAEASDSAGAKSLPVEVRFTVGDANAAPTIAITSPETGDSVPRGQASEIQVAVDDADGQVVAVRFFADGVLLGQDGSEPFSFAWTPPANGTVILLAEAMDDGGQVTPSADVSVHVDEPTGDALQVVIVEPAVPRKVALGQTITVRATVTGAIDLAGVEFLVDGVVVQSDTSAPFQINLGGLTEGVHQLTARALDYGRTALSLPVVVTVGRDNGSAPSIAITDPSADGLVVTAQHVVRGRVTTTNPGADIDRWSLVLRGADADEGQTIATGRGAVDGALGVIDATALRNGPFILELTSVDTIGRSVSLERRLKVKGDAKVGEFAVSFTDLVVPVAGIPLAMVRTYRSFDRWEEGELGFGWTASLTDLQVSLDDRRAPEVDAAFETFSKRTGGTWDVTLTLPDTGKRVTFRSEIIAAQIGTQELRWYAPAGTTASLVPIGNVRITALFTSPPYWNELGPYSANDFQAFDVPGWILTLADGTRYRVEREDLGLRTYVTPVGTQGITHAYGKPRLVAISQPSGDTIAISANGIQHVDPQGNPTRGLVYTRDTQGRIVAVHDPNGQDEAGAISGPAAVTYQYDAQGDLIAASRLVSVDPDTGTPTYETSTYHYENPVFPHYLTRIVDPRGTPVRMEYDASGRLIAMIDGDGNRTELEHDVGNREERIADAEGNITTYQYDAGGNVTVEIDPLGRTIRRSYDSQGNVISETDPLGHTTRRSFDAKGNQTSETDPLGHTTTWTYDSFGNVLTTTDPLGRTTTNTYDGNGKLLTTTDAMGNVTTFAYSPQGYLLSETDALGYVTTYAYDGFGNMTTLTDALGNGTAFTYDRNGNQTGQTQTRTRLDGMEETITTDLAYDGQARVTSVVDALGNRTRLGYTLGGEVGGVTDALGRKTSYRYDSRGNLIRIEHADGTVEASVLNALGRRTQSTDRVGRVTTFAYDVTGNLTQVTAPDGTTTQTVYDAAGHVTRVTAADGTATVYGYDAAGRQTSVTDAAGQTTTTVYDAVGQVTEVTDALGRTTSFTYDALGRQLTTTLPDGTSTSSEYDALGRRTAEVDALGRRTVFAYDGLGRLTSVTDAAGEVTVYSYDEVGNQRTQVDALGRITRYDYDAAGRRILRQLPLGQRETSVYDVVGRLTHQTDFLGRTTQRQYDTANRLTAIIPDVATGEPGISFTYHPDGRRASMTDAVGTTMYGYDAAGRLTTKATPIGTIQYGYDATGRLVTTTTEAGAGTGSVPAATQYGYDAAGRLGTVTGLGFGIQRYAYRADGSLGSARAPNAVETTYAYDSAGRLRDLLSATADGDPLARYTYTLRANGHRSEVTELSGRTVAYTYDVLDRLVTETISGAGPASGQIAYVMDAVGNRLSRTSTVSGVTNQTFTYDANDRLSMAPYTSDANGNTLTSPGVTTTPDAYSFHNRLLRRVGDDGVVVEILYDGDANKVGERIDGVTTWFLVDTMNPTGYAQTLEERVGTWNATERRLENVSVRRSYLLGLDVIGQRDANAGVRIFGYDGHGSLRYLTNTLAEVTDTFDYDAYGVLVHRTGTTDCRYGYAGEEGLSALGLGYNRARWLDWGVGRFWTMDEWEGDESPGSLHKYFYANGNPIEGIDPAGNFTITEMLGALQIRVSQLAPQVQKLENVSAKLRKAIDAIIKLQMRLNAAVALMDQDLIPAAVFAIPYQEKLIRDSRKRSNTATRFRDPRRLIETMTRLLSGVAAHARGVPLKPNGHPDFGQFRHSILPVIFISYQGSRTADFALADKVRLGLPRTLFGKKYTWHHHELIGVMELVRSDVHNVGVGGIAHEGGVWYWEHLFQRRYNVPRGQKW